MLFDRFSDPVGLGITLLAVVVALSIHEWAHSWAAHKLGDTTSADEGRLTLNPMKHIDPLGFIFLVLVGFGWGKPVMVDHLRLKWQRWGGSFVSLAGPFSNFALALFLLLVIRCALYVTPDAFLFGNNLGSDFFFSVIIVNLSLGLFNLIPVPPLDGSKVLMDVLRLSDWQRAKWEHYGPFALIALLVLDSIGQGGFISSGLGFFIRAVFSLFGLA